MKAMETTPRMAYNRDTEEKYWIDMPVREVVIQAILKLDWPPGGMGPKEVVEILAEEWELSEEEKTAVTISKNNSINNKFYHVVWQGLNALFKKNKLDRKGGKYWPI